GFRWAPDTVPMKKMMAITMMPGASAFVASVRAPPYAVAPTTPPPAATSTRRNVPQTSLNSRRYSSRGLSKSIAAWRYFPARRATQATMGSASGEPRSCADMSHPFTLTAAFGALARGGARDTSPQGYPEVTHGWRGMSYVPCSLADQVGRLTPHAGQPPLE